MRFGVLGPLLLEDDTGVDVLPGSPNQRLILACLLAESGVSVRADALADAIWGDEPPASVDTSLRTYVSRLRRVLGDRLAGDGTTYVLQLAPGDELDAERFDRLVRDGGTDGLADALALWRGDAFCDVADVELVAAQARRLDELRAVAVDQHLEARYRAASGGDGDPGPLIADAEAHLARYPLRESAWGVLVRALVLAGRPADGLRAYQRAVAALAEAGLEPSAGLRAAEQVALGLAEPGEPGGAGEPVPSAVPRPGWSAEPATSLVGRADDLEQVEALLAEAGVVTLHGAGGVGKTRLARAVAARTIDRDGRVAVAPLARVAGTDATRSAILDALGVAVDDGSSDAALVAAARVEALLVIDNCEHVIDDVAAAVELLSGPTSQLRILCTSRERLGVAGEMSWSLAPLSTEDVDGPAVELFIDRLRAMQPRFEATPDERRTIRRIVERVDGLPLAIEMAAARAGSIGLAELEAALGQRLDILRSGTRLADARHRTLRAVIEWSEELLGDDERHLFRDLAVFAGPVPSGHIEVVLDRPGAIATLSDLVDRSLLVADVSGPTTTFRLLQTVRQHILAATDGQPRQRDLAIRHGDHYVEQMRAADQQLRRPDEPDAVATITALMAEVRATHRRAVEDAPARAVALSAALHAYAVSRSSDEMQRWADELVARHAPTGPDAVLVYTTAAYRANNQSRYDDARALAGRAVELAAGDPVDRFAHEVLSDTALYNGDIDTALAEAKLILDQSFRAEDPYGIAAGYCGTVLALAYSGQREAAIEVLADVETTGWGPTAIGWYRYSLGEVLLDGDPDPAIAHLQAAIELADSVGARFLAGVARVSASSLLARHGEPDEALLAFDDSIEHWRTHRQSTHQITTLRNLVVLFGRLGDHRAVARLLGSLEVAGGSLSFGEEAALLADVADEAGRALGPAYDELLAEGAGRDLDGAVGVAMADIARLLAEG